ncbi:hypothetical protein MGG_15620 [Pyricularia oryzae 70-15]|uniref:Uncharacterized protein n=2 Tax=Pyricularia oryzae TaxID=318829 RepID=G4MW34_PYRO7|nr:uncharacterized protein MGG_15620 [Pyricularia oryzae 70-15]EHA54187.1 hypothetical protein MGG_15620 [Pyricularia oryzae 70-15]ELQ39350.1 hypothetical protein OOU_Y34scaffold00501g1 [Pyricularia oryzae Y34]
MKFSIVLFHFTAAAYGIALSAGGVIMPHLISRATDPCASQAARNSKSCCQKTPVAVQIEGQAECAQRGKEFVGCDKDAVVHCQ